MDPTWSADRGVKDWREFMARYAPDGDIRDQNYVFGYNFAMALEHVLKAAGNDLSPENIHKQAYSIRDLELPMLLPGIKVNTAPDDHMPVKQMQFMRFDGKQWERFGDLDDELTLLPIWKHVCFSRRIEAIGKVASRRIRSL